MYKFYWNLKNHLNRDESLFIFANKTFRFYRIFIVFRHIFFLCFFISSHFLLIFTRYSMFLYKFNFLYIFFIIIINYENFYFYFLRPFFALFSLLQHHVAWNFLKYFFFLTKLIHMRIIWKSSWESFKKVFHFIYKLSLLSCVIFFIWYHFFIITINNFYGEDLQQHDENEDNYLFHLVF